LMPGKFRIEMANAPGWGERYAQKEHRGERLEGKNRSCENSYADRVDRAGEQKRFSLEVRTETLQKS